MPSCHKANEMQVRLQRDILFTLSPQDWGWYEALNARDQRCGAGKGRG